MRLVRGDRVLAAGDRFVLSELILEALQREARGALEVSTLDLPWPVEPYGPVAEVEEASGTEEQMIEAVNCVEVVVTQLAPLTARVLEAANNLRLVVCTRGGPVNVNVEAASVRGVTARYAPGRNASAAAEYAVGLMLAAMRRIPEAHGSLSSGQWRGEFLRLRGVWRRARRGYRACRFRGDRSPGGASPRGLRRQVVVYDPFVDAADIEEAGGSSVKLDELLERPGGEPTRPTLPGYAGHDRGARDLAYVSGFRAREHGPRRTSRLRRLSATPSSPGISGPLPSTCTPRNPSRRTPASSRRRGSCSRHT